jgi:hypothetical protein
MGGTGGQMQVSTGDQGDWRERERSVRENRSL